MPIILILVGAMFVIAGIKNNGPLLMQTLSSDFSGAGSFWYWILAVIVIGSIGYYQPAKKVSHLFLFLIVLVFILSNGGIYSQIEAAIANPTPAASNEGSEISDPTSNKLATASGISPSVANGILEWARKTNPVLGIGHMLGLN